MDPIFPQHGRITPAITTDPFPLRPAPAFAQRDRLDRLATLAPEDKTAGLVWLALNSPATCDAMLDAVESDLRYDSEDASREPEPFCATCGADVGIFLRFGVLTGGITAAMALQQARSNSSTPATPGRSPGAQPASPPRANAHTVPAGRWPAGTAMPETLNAVKPSWPNGMSGRTGESLL